MAEPSGKNLVTASHLVTGGVVGSTWLVIWLVTSHLQYQLGSELITFIWIWAVIIGTGFYEPMRRRIVEWLAS